MTIFFYLGTTADFNAPRTQLAYSSVRLADGGNVFAQTANQGDPSFSSLVVDDPGGALTFVGLRPFMIEETACNPSRMWTGYVTSRTYQRDPGKSQVVGADRTVALTLVDINAILGLRVIAFNDGIRPAETDLARVAWLLGTSYMGSASGSQVYDNGQIAASTSITMDAADYRGQYPVDVLNDCANASGRNYFVYWDPTKAAGHELSLYYHLLGFTIGFASTLQLSNTSTAIDSSTTFAATGVLTRDPQDVASSVWMPYDGGHVFVTRAATATAFIARQAVAPANKTKSITTATKRANAFLTAASVENDIIDAHVRIPASKVNLIDIGRALNVHFDHLPGYTAGYTSLQVVGRQITQVVENPDWYEMDVKLSNPKPSGGASGGGSGAPFVQDCVTIPFDITLTQGATPHDLSVWNNDGGTPWLDNLVDGTVYNLTWTFTNGIADDSGHLEYSRRIGFTTSDPTASGFSPPFATWLPGAADSGAFGTNDLEPQTGNNGAVLTATGTYTVNLTTAAANGWVAGQKLYFYGHGGWSPGTGSGGRAQLVMTPVVTSCTTPNIGQTIPFETASSGTGTTSTTTTSGGTTHTVTTYTTNYPYQSGSLLVTVNGIVVVPTEVNPATGTFTLTDVPAGSTVNVSYQASSPIANVTSNPVATASSASGAVSLTDASGNALGTRKRNGVLKLMTADDVTDALLVEVLMELQNISELLATE